MINLFNQQNAFLNEHSEKKESLREKIKEYLDRVGTVGDPVALQLLKSSAELLQAQKQIDDEVAMAPNIHIDTLQSIQQIPTRKEQKDTTPQSYVAAATGRGRDGPAPPAKKNVKSQPTSKDKTPIPKEARRAREITVHITENADKENMKLMPTKELVETLQNGAEGIRGVSHLLNGDIRFHTESLEAKKILQEKTDWTRMMAASAAVNTRTFTVRANRIRVENIKVANQSTAIAYLQAANARLHPDLKIIKVAWSVKVIREKKAYSTLHMEVATAEMANRLISEGLIEDHELKDCERFTRGCTMTQCFNCKKYGHRGKTCRNPAACGHCTGGYQSKECNLETTGQYRRCAVCGEKGHEAWSTACKIRKAQKGKTEIAVQNRAPLYTIESQSPSFQFRGAPTLAATQTNEISSTWKIVKGKERKMHNAGLSADLSPGFPEESKYQPGLI